MKESVKDLWVAALRSGEYRQGTGALATNQFDDLGEVKERHYCCLGVLCDIAIRNGLKVKFDEHHDSMAFDGESALLPDSVQQWAGMTTSDGEYEHIEEDDDVTIATLAEMNDSGSDFLDIADIIEDKWMEL